ncbi:MAG: EAL domain-containing protein [Burkholderiaceae bacterium]|nr:EAL domain-containing protein [Burkholderiaceae bacterium]
MNSLGQIKPSDDEARLAGLAFELSLDMLCVLTPEGLFERVNPAWAQTLGWSEAQLLGRCWLELAHAEQRALLEQAVATAPPRAKGFELQGQFACADGSLRDLAWRWQRTADGRSICVVRDITAQKLAEQSLRESEDRWKLALESAGDGVWDWYPQTGVEIFSRRFIEMYGYSEEELTSRPEEFDKRTHPDDIEQLLRDRQAHIEGRTPTYINEHRVQCKDGSWKWILTRGMVISRDGQGRPLRMIGTHTDITSRKQDEALIWQQAHFDGLTGLPNRRMLRERLAQAMARCAASERQLALLFIDLDHFKEVNDTLGHDKGDLLLIQAAQRIAHCLREGDTVARMGGDEFTVVMPGLGDPGEVEVVAQAILDALAAGFQLGNELSFVSASIGITLYPQDAELIEDLFKHADQALYVAKDAGRKRFSYFTPALQEAAQNRLRLANDLRAALGADQFEVHYQPIIELGSGAVHKAEALLRWQHPTRGPVAPNLFIPIAEASGLIIDIGDWVFRQAAAQVSRWRAELHPDFQISINKSPVQFRVDAQQGPVWAAWLQSLGLPGHSLVVEITEGLLLDGSTDVAARLMDLHAAGIGVSLDDFGTGYSSLSYLQKFDIDYLKIDQSFVRGLNPLSKDMALCRAIIVMAHELGMKVIAEGVETPLQRDLLAEAGCDYAQGYLFAKAMPPDAFEAWLATWAP